MNIYLGSNGAFPSRTFLLSLSFVSSYIVLSKLLQPAMKYEIFKSIDITPVTPNTKIYKSETIAFPAELNRDYEF